MYSSAEFFSCYSESTDEFKALTCKLTHQYIVPTMVKYRNTIPFADYIERLGWKKEAASSTD
jgi:hypothetical protein